MKKRPQKKISSSRHNHTASLPASSLRFSPTAWSKLLYLRDYGDTEVGGFGVSSTDDLLFVEEILLVGQQCSWARVAFDDASVADFFDRQVDNGRRPEQFGRIWVHTHPGDSPHPSPTDEATFNRVFGRAHWAVMYILAKGGATYARLRFNIGPGAETTLPVDVDYSRPFGAADHLAWEQEYLANVRPERPLPMARAESGFSLAGPLDEDPDSDWYEDWFEYANNDNDLEDSFGESEPDNG